MKGLMWYGERDLRYTDIPEPSPAQDQVKIKVKFAGICGSDLERYQHGSFMIGKGKVPITLGHEFTGEVVALGEEITDFKIGDRVTGIVYWLCGQCYFCRRNLNNLCLSSDNTSVTKEGCMAEYFVAPSYSVYKLPESVSDEIGTLVEPLAVGIHAANQGNVRTGNTVVVVGDGTIGLCALLAARAAGASEVYVVAKHKGRGDLASSFGAKEVIYINEGDTVSQFMKLTNDLGADIAIESVGRPEAPQLAVNLVRRGGRVVLTGHYDNPIPFNFGTMTFSEKTIIGSNTYIDEASAAIAMLADGRIGASRLITSIVPLKDAVELGFEKLLNDKENNVKVLLEVA